MISKILRPVLELLAYGIGFVRVEGNRRLYWSVYYPYNFGDWVGPYLYYKLTGLEPLFSMPNPFSRDTVTMAAGSILAGCTSNVVVWGSGVLKADERFMRPWRVLAVRGPMSRQAFLRQGYPCPEVYGDPAILLPRVYQPVAAERRYPLGIVPHFRDYARVREAVAGMEDVRVIDVRHPMEEVIDGICSCERIASTSLHGLIVAHAYGIKAQWVYAGHRSGDGVKYRDYFLSAGLEPYEPVVPVWRERQAVLDGIDGTALPSLDGLRDGLMEVCPFPVAAPARERQLVAAGA